MQENKSEITIQAKQTSSWSVVKSLTACAQRRVDRASASSSSALSQLFKKKRKKKLHEGRSHECADFKRVFSFHIFTLFHFFFCFHANSQSLGDTAQKRENSRGQRVDVVGRDAAEKVCKVGKVCRKERRICLFVFKK